MTWQLRWLAGLLFLVALCAHAGASELSSGIVRVEYAPADEVLAQETLSLMESSMLEFGARLSPGSDPIVITICSSLAQFRERAGQYGMARVGGIAKSPQGVIIVKAPYLLPDGTDYRGTVRHELIHVLIARNTDAVNVPRWFDEGLAMVLSGELRWESGLRIARMYARHGLIPYRELNFAFAPIGGEELFGDAYAQALSMTRYIAANTGKERFWQLVASLNTMSFEEALQQYANMTPASLYDSWQRSLWKVAILASLVSGFTLFQFMALLAVVAYVCKQRRGRKLIKQWEEEEDEPEIFSWDRLEEGPYPWEEEYQDEEEERF